MWEMELKGNIQQKQGKVVNPVGSLEDWYQKGNKYWEVLLIIMQNTDPSYNGVLGGYGNLSSLDIQYSLKFLMGYFMENK